MSESAISRRVARPVPEAIDLRIVFLRGLPVLIGSSLAEVTASLLRR